MGHERQIGLEQTLEFDEGLLVENDVIDLVDADAGFAQTRGNGLVWERRILLHASEALLLGRSNDTTIND